MDINNIYIYISVLDVVAKLHLYIPNIIFRVGH